MNHDQIDRVRESFTSLVPRGPELFATFVGRLAADAPALRALFPAEPRERWQEFLSPCGLVIKNLHRLGAIEYLLNDMGAKNQLRGVLPQHYGIARDALLDLLREAHSAPGRQGGPEWSDELAADWAEAINCATSLMIRGAGRARRKAA